jgi:hypothetical protein
MLEGPERLLKAGDITPEAADKLTKHLRNTVVGELTEFVVAGYPEPAERWITSIDEALDELYAATERLYQEAEEKELDERRKDALAQRRRAKHAEREHAVGLGDFAEGAG